MIKASSCAGCRASAATVGAAAFTSNSAARAERRHARAPRSSTRTRSELKASAARTSAVGSFGHKSYSSAAQRVRSWGGAPLRGALQAAYEQLRAAATTVARACVAAGLPVDEVEYVDRFNPDLMEVLFQWTNGAKFVDLTKLTDAFEGTIIRVIRRLDELLRLGHRRVRVLCSADQPPRQRLSVVRLVVVAAVVAAGGGAFGARLPFEERAQAARATLPPGVPRGEPRAHLGHAEARVHVRDGRELVGDARRELLGGGVVLRQPLAVVGLSLIHISEPTRPY